MTQKGIILIILTLITNLVIGQDSTKTWQLGIKAVQQLNYPISHSIVSLNLSKQNHNIYIGPNYTRLFSNYFGDELVNSYENNSMGLNVGYRYMIDSKWNRIKLFIQLDFSLYKVKYKTYQGHGIGVRDAEKIVIENNGGLGLNYKLSNKMELFGGLGIGSTEVFFFMLDGFIPHSFIGLEYKLK